jgi:hypothetical protein
MQTAQERFDAQYVSGYEIRKRLKVQGCTVALALKRGKLPQPIRVGAATYVWERAVIEPFLLEWEHALARRAKVATA